MDIPQHQGTHGVIVMLNENTLYSTLYGHEGHKELATMRKKLRQGREAIGREGDPVHEHLLVPSAKLPTLRVSVSLINHHDFNRMQQAKLDRQTFSLAHVSPVTVPDNSGSYEESQPRVRKQGHRPRINLEDIE